MFPQEAKIDEARGSVFLARSREKFFTGSFVIPLMFRYDEKLSTDAVLRFPVSSCLRNEQSPSLLVHFPARRDMKQGESDKVIPFFFLFFKGLSRCGSRVTASVVTGCCLLPRSEVLLQILAPVSMELQREHVGTKLLIALADLLDLFMPKLSALSGCRVNWELIGRATFATPFSIALDL